jgi:hypothetical protein
MLKKVYKFFNLKDLISIHYIFIKIKKCTNYYYPL